MNRFRTFMMGRYGADQLTMAILITAVILNIVFSYVAVPLLWILPLLLLAFGVFRMFSKNIYKRQAENQKFLRVWYPVSGWFKKIFKRAADKNYKYFRCQSCGQEMRVPKGKGKIMVTCPKCGNRFMKKS